ncbi:accessory Sec system S-layer assembly protein [Pontibacillus yanchengensis]|uniref:Accessory Sec system S-layer assembly protein n=1 Tax=Pontibacillus yanchengensis TaxID=462910 RepID=A0A6I4ZUQ0_9BACI|nr:accessory Sec system S-layer assembly protein [Pontibacillus yanchengensis]MYL33955.1 accessory Sec system S-layer assembly protein [Pontibacillus yanchengensis]
MLNFLKRNKNEENEQPTRHNDSTVDANELLEDVQEESSEEQVDTELSLHPSWKLDEEEVYVYRFMNNEHPPLKPNQISLAGFELHHMDDQISVGAFVRNSLNKKISFNETTLILMTEDGTKLGRKEFDLSSLDELPAKSSRPYPFIFDENDLFVPVEEIPLEGWKLAFELKKSAQKHSLDLAESWQQSLASEDLEKLKEYTESLQPPKPGEVNFMGLKAVQADNGDLHVTMLIRNGSEKNISLQQLPLQFEDASGQVVARGGFQLDNFEVKANTSKPWTFIFPRAMIDTDELDLSKWKAYPTQQNQEG